MTVSVRLTDASAGNPATFRTGVELERVRTDHYGVVVRVRLATPWRGRRVWKVVKDRVGAGKKKGGGPM